MREATGGSDNTACTAQHHAHPGFASEPLSDVLGHGLELNVSLQKLLRNPQAMAQFATNYCKWISGTEYAQDLCFLDITFIDVSQQAGSETDKAHTLLLTSDPQQLAVYQDVLWDMFYDGYTTTGHVVFQNGLPLFRNSATNELSMPQTCNEFTRSVNDRTFEVGGEGYQLWIGDHTDDRAQCKPVANPLAHRHFPTYKAPKNPGPSTKSLLARVSERPFQEMWDRYVAGLHAQTANLRSRAGGQLNTIVGLPIGVRSEENRGKFLRVADVYFGLAGLPEGEEGDPVRDRLKERAWCLLRLLIGQLYRANMSAFSHTLAVLKSANAFGHEIKHISMGITGRWMPEPTSLFAVKVAPRNEIPFPPDSLGTRTGVGLIHIDQEYAWLAQEMGILPLRDLLLDSGKLIRLWCMLESEPEFKIELTEKTNLLELLEACLYEGQRMMMPHFFKVEAIVDTTSLKALRETYRLIDGVFRSQPLAISDKAVAEAIPVGQWLKTVDNNKLRPKQLYWLIRSLLTTFKDCIQHGDPTKPLVVNVTQEPDRGTFTVEIKSTKRPKHDDLIAALGKLMTEAEADWVTTLLEKGATGADTLTTAFKSKDVLELCLAELNGTLDEYLANNEVATCITRFKCPLPVEAE